MKIAFFSMHGFERDFLTAANKKHSFELSFFNASLNLSTAPLANGFDCVCCFVSDHLDANVLKYLKGHGIRLVALRSAGYNNVDLETADLIGLPVVRVPAYSPHAVAEHAVALLLCLDRKIHRASARVHEMNFSVDGLVGFDLYGKTVGVIGTGRIGSIFATIMKGFGCQVLAYDKDPSPTLTSQKIVTYVSKHELYAKSDIISLHVPLFPDTQHMINTAALGQMKRGVILLNTGRGALIDSTALIEGLKSGQIGSAGLDVYEEEDGIFFHDLSEQVLKDDTLARLLTFPNVLMTSHQGFLTIEALRKIAEITFQNISDFEFSQPLANQLHAATHLKFPELQGVPVETALSSSDKSPPSSGI